MSEYTERAAQLRALPACPNCAETILMVFAERMGISGETARALGTNFGGGMKCGDVCGAVTAGLMVLGALGLNHPSDAITFRRRISENHGGLINCADLLRVNAEQGRAKKPHCDEMILESIALIEQMAGIE